MNENQAKYNYTGDKPSPQVKAHRMAVAEREEEAREAAEKLLEIAKRNHYKATTNKAKKTKGKK